MTVGAEAIEFIMGLHWYSWCIIVGTGMVIYWMSGMLIAAPLLLFFEFRWPVWAWLITGVGLVAIGVLNMPAC